MAQKLNKMISVEKFNKTKRRNRGWNSNRGRPARRADETTIEPRYRMKIHALTYLNSACLLDSRKSESIDFYLSIHPCISPEHFFRPR